MEGPLSPIFYLCLCWTPQHLTQVYLCSSLAGLLLGAIIVGLIGLLRGTGITARSCPLKSSTPPSASPGSEPSCTCEVVLPDSVLDSMRAFAWAADLRAFTPWVLAWLTGTGWSTRMSCLERCSRWTPSPKTKPSKIVHRERRRLPLPCSFTSRPQCYKTSASDCLLYSSGYGTQDEEPGDGKLTGFVLGVLVHHHGGGAAGAISCPSAPLGPCTCLPVMFGIGYNSVIILGSAACDLPR